MQVRVFLGTDWHRNYDLLKKPDYYVKVSLFSCCPLDSIYIYAELIILSRSDV